MFKFVGGIAIVFFMYEIIWRMRLPMRIWSLLLLIVYAPFSYKYPIQFAPFVNMTSILQVFLLVSVVKDFSVIKLPKLFCIRMVVAWMTCITLVYLVAVVSVERFGGFFSTLPEFKKWLEPYLLALYAFAVIREEHLPAVKSTILLTASLVVWHALFEGMDIGSKIRIGGVFEQANQLAAFISYYSPFLLLGIVNYRGVLRLYFIVSIFSAVLGILYTQSRAGMLGFIIGGMTSSLFSRRTLLFLPVFLLIFGLISIAAPDVLQKMTDRVESTFVSDQPSSMGGGMEDKVEISAAMRIVIWGGALNMIFDHPLGVGFDQFRNRMLEYCRLSNPYDTHNFYLRVATEFGIPCFLVFIVMLISLTRESFSQFRSRLKAEPLLAAGMVGCMAAIWFQNFFGTRFIDLGLVGPMWIGIAGLISMKETVSPKIEVMA